MTREEAIKELEEIAEMTIWNYRRLATTMAIEALSAEADWIPVSERLPDIGDTYLVTVMVGKEIRTDVADSFGSYIDGFWDTFNDWIEDEECHVIAWMPLPEPYKGGDDSE